MVRQELNLASFMDNLTQNSYTVSYFFNQMAPRVLMVTAALLLEMAISGGPQNPLDLFRWGFVKDKGYANSPQTINDLKRNVRRVINETEPEICQNIFYKFCKRMTTLT